jgi:hypothetical protein
MGNIVKSTRWLLGIFTLGAVIVFGLIGLVINLTAPDSESESQNSVYIEECGSCHLAYPPGLLPAVSWHEIMLGLEDHFEDNAELDQETADEISQYLDDHALTMGRPSTMSKMLRNIPEQPPIRITKLPAFIDAHEDVSIKREIQDDEGVFLSRCTECHKDAELGVFDEESTTEPSS